MISNLASFKSQFDFTDLTFSGFTSRVHFMFRHFAFRLELDQSKVHVIHEEQKKIYCPVCHELQADENICSYFLFGAIHETTAMVHFILDEAARFRIANMPKLVSTLSSLQFSVVSQDKENQLLNILVTTDTSSYTLELDYNDHLPTLKARLLFSSSDEEILCTFCDQEHEAGDECFSFDPMFMRQVMDMIETELT